MRVVLLAAALLAVALPVRAEPVTVFAAASLTNAMEAVGAAYAERTNDEIRFSFASSSTLARQIEAGAPAQIYASANERWMDYVEARDLIAAETRLSPIGNRLVLVAAADKDAREVEVTSALDLASLLGPDGRLAVGDPAHVPAGMYAREALERLGLWTAAEPRLARADNVRAALALVERGEAPYGIVYATDAAIADGVDVVGTFPAESHTPITYPFAVVAGAEGEAVEDFFAFMTSDAALAIYARFGFVTD